MYCMCIDKYKQRCIITKEKNNLHPFFFFHIYSISKLFPLHLNVVEGTEAWVVVLMPIDLNLCPFCGLFCLHEDIKTRLVQRLCYNVHLIFLHNQLKNHIFHLFENS